MSLGGVESKEWGGGGFGFVVCLISLCLAPTPKSVLFSIQEMYDRAKRKKVPTTLYNKFIEAEMRRAERLAARERQHRADLHRGHRGLLGRLSPRAPPVALTELGFSAGRKERQRLAAQKAAAREAAAAAEAVQVAVGDGMTDGMKEDTDEGRQPSRIHSLPVLPIAAVANNSRPRAG